MANAKQLFWFLSFSDSSSPVHHHPYLLRFQYLSPLHLITSQDQENPHRNTFFLYSSRQNGQPTGVSRFPYVLACFLATDRKICSTNLIIILGMMQVSKKIPFDDPQVLLGVRALYVVSNILIAGIYLYLNYQINKKKGRHTSFKTSSQIFQDSKKLIKTTLQISPHSNMWNQHQWVQQRSQNSSQQPSTVTTSLNYVAYGNLKLWVLV